MYYIKKMADKAFFESKISFSLPRAKHQTASDGLKIKNIFRLFSTQLI